MITLVADENEIPFYFLFSILPILFRFGWPQFVTKKEGNENKKETALRETQEEIGIKKDEIQIIGKLSEIYVPPSNFLIFPFIGYCSSTPLFTADQNEVDEIIKIQLDELFKNDVVKSTYKSIIHNGQRFNMSVPFLDLNGRDVWGATGAILNELKVILSS